MKRVTKAMLVELSRVCGHHVDAGQKLEWFDDGGFWWLYYMGDGEGLLFFPADKPEIVRGCISVVEQFAVPVLSTGRANRYVAYEQALAHAKWCALPASERSATDAPAEIL